MTREPGAQSDQDHVAYRHVDQGDQGPPSIPMVCLWCFTTFEAEKRADGGYSMVCDPCVERALRVGGGTTTERKKNTGFVSGDRGFGDAT